MLKQAQAAYQSDSAAVKEPTKIVEEAESTAASLCAAVKSDLAKVTNEYQVSIAKSLGELESLISPPG